MTSTVRKIRTLTFSRVLFFLSEKPTLYMEKFVPTIWRKMWKTDFGKLLNVFCQNFFCKIFFWRFFRGLKWEGSENNRNEDEEVIGSDLQ